MNVAAWITVGLLAVAAPLNWWGRWPATVLPGGADRERWDTVTKPIPTVLVIALAVALDAPVTATAWCVAALVFCLVGDVALLAAVDRFVVGLASFLVGHLAFVGQMAALGFDGVAWGAGAAAVLVVFGLSVGLRIVRSAAASERALRLPVGAYLVVIAVMTVSAWATGLPWAMVGAAAFVVSDSILGWGKFVAGRRWMPLAVMVTYHWALVGLTLSLIG
jgi:uncharacterized membrane protein YhhN